MLGNKKKRWMGGL